MIPLAATQQRNLQRLEYSRSGVGEVSDRIEPVESMAGDLLHAQIEWPLVGHGQGHGGRFDSGNLAYAVETLAKQSRSCGACLIARVLE